MGIRVNRNVSVKERKTYIFDNFKGVDFSTSPHKVAGNRATQAKNLIYKDGTVRKRNGWESLCKLKGRINGLFSFELAGEKVILCYAGTEFYLLTWDESLNRYTKRNMTNSCTYAPSKLDTLRLKENRPQVLINNDKAYIVGCGDYLVLGKWGGDIELRRVYNNEDTYIPTTTINIDMDGVEDEHKAVLDDVNLLSAYRKNEFLGVDEKTLPFGTNATWTVDTAIEGVAQAIDENSKITIEGYVYVIVGVNEDGGYRYAYVAIKATSGNGTAGSDIDTLYVTESDYPHNVTVGRDIGTVDRATGKITLFYNTKPQEEDTANIIVTFKKETEGQEDLVANATLATVFGGGGDSNRLFVGGNPSRQNVHAWSELYNFTYFSDKNFDKLGSDSSAITGYVKVSDGTLLAFKEKNGSDSTVYYITGVDVYDEVDYRGDPVFITKFYKKAGNMSDTIYSKYATASLNGDNLILTKNGVKGLQFYENIAIESYRIQERGRNINGKLLRHENLSDACGFVFKDKYYLSVNETLPIYNEYGEVVREEKGVVYIADSRFTFQDNEDINNSYNYEWWYYTNVDARVWCEIDNELYFGTSDGLICRFAEDYTDTTYQNTEENDLMVDTNNNAITFNMSLDSDLTDNDEIEFTINKYNSVEILNDSDVYKVTDYGYIVVTEEEIIDKFYSGMYLYADQIAENVNLSLDTKYAVGDIDRNNLRFKLLQNGVVVDPVNKGFRLYEKNKINMYALFLSSDVLAIDKDGFIVVSEENINNIYDGIKLYADQIEGETNLTPFTEYEVGEVDRDNLRFPLLLGGVKINPVSGGFRLHKKVSEKKLYVTNIDYENSNFQVKEFEGGDVLKLNQYNYEIPTKVLATIKYKQNVRAEWYTPIYDLGTNMFSKTLFNITIATEPLIKGSITAGYQTRNLEKDFSAKNSREFDFNDINFEDFSFEGSFASSFTIRAKERNFNFIVIRYVSDNQNSCAVNSITIRYKINQINKGVR